MIGLATSWATSITTGFGLSGVEVYVEERRAYSSRRMPMVRRYS